GARSTEASRSTGSGRGWPRGPGTRSSAMKRESRKASPVRRPRQEQSIRSRGRPRWGSRGGLWYGTMGREEGPALVRLVVEQPPGPGGDGGQRVLREVHRNLAVARQAHVQASEQRPPSREEHPCLEHV